MKFTFLLLALLVGVAPVKAQLDQKWRDQQAGNTECQKRYRKAQYKNIKKNLLLSSPLPGRYYIGSDNTIWLISLTSGSGCFQSKVAVLGKQSKKRNNGIIGGMSFVLYKVEEGRLIEYSEPGYSSGSSNVTMEVVGESI